MTSEQILNESIDRLEYAATLNESVGSSIKKAFSKLKKNLKYTGTTGMSSNIDLSRTIANVENVLKDVNDDEVIKPHKLYSIIIYLIDAVQLVNIGASTAKFMGVHGDTKTLIVGFIKHIINITISSVIGLVVSKSFASKQVEILNSYKDYLVKIKEKNQDDKESDINRTVDKAISDIDKAIAKIPE